jgi:hypothetical protein
MGHQVSDNGLIIDDSKIRAKRDMPVPKDKNGVQRLLGMCNILSQFVPKLSEICSPLREISNMNAEFCQSASPTNCIHTYQINDYQCLCASIL